MGECGAIGLRRLNLGVAVVQQFWSAVILIVLYQVPGSMIHRCVDA